RRLAPESTDLHSHAQAGMRLLSDSIVPMPIQASASFRRTGTFRYLTPSASGSGNCPARPPGKPARAVLEHRSENGLNVADMFAYGHAGTGLMLQIRCRTQMAFNFP